ncbi:hypothetical protein PTTG_07658 [Puccinia triticina 1-1 BBBD Race 1]|uniref:Peptidase A2 domain-containing protein n=1 Tax=Puccinia triticina (isolate 1-1 / race 1 (BBBD)) TaxID=630390 RepID=A0A180GL12_PUCT1|nr:hypothetical protein PTTG_07658 [Puccinia triticina 1-1 BBBD Race 1]
MAAPSHLVTSSLHLATSPSRLVTSPLVLTPSRPNTPALANPPRPPPRVIVSMKLNDAPMRVLIDMGLEINLISLKAAKASKLQPLPLATPTRVHLAMKTPSSTPLLLKEYVVCDLKTTDTTLVFCEVSLRIGPVIGLYDTILGTPFLFHYDLLVSI